MSFNAQHHQPQPSREHLNAVSNPVPPSATGGAAAAAPGRPSPRVVVASRQRPESGDTNAWPPTHHQEKASQHPPKTFTFSSARRADLNEGCGASELIHVGIDTFVAGSKQFRTNRGPVIGKAARSSAQSNGTAPSSGGQPGEYDYSHLFGIGKGKGFFVSKAPKVPKPPPPVSSPAGATMSEEKTHKSKAGQWTISKTARFPMIVDALGRGTSAGPRTHSPRVAAAKANAAANRRPVGLEFGSPGGATTSSIPAAAASIPNQPKGVKDIPALRRNQHQASAGGGSSHLDFIGNNSIIPGGSPTPWEGVAVKKRREGGPSTEEDTADREYREENDRRHMTRHVRERQEEHKKKLTRPLTAQEKRRALVREMQMKKDEPTSRHIPAPRFLSSGRDYGNNGISLHHQENAVGPNQKPLALGGAFQRERLAPNLRSCRFLKLM